MSNSINALSEIVKFHLEENNLEPQDIDRLIKLNTLVEEIKFHLEENNLEIPPMCKGEQDVN